MMDMTEKDLEKERVKLFRGQTWEEAFPEVMKSKTLANDEILRLGDLTIINQDSERVLFKHIDGYYISLYRWQAEKLAKFVKGGVKLVKVVKGKKNLGMGKWITTTNFVPVHEDGSIMVWDGEKWV